MLLLALPATALRPVDLVCFGDSNTARGWPTADTVRWCEYAAAACPTVRINGGSRRAARWHNLGIGGAVVAPVDLCRDFTFGPLPTWPCFDWALSQAVPADAAFIAYGTNDAGVAGSTPTAYAAHVEAACAKAKAPCFVMTMPPHPQFDHAAYDAAVAALVPARRLVDRTTDVTLQPDGIHLDDASERLLAARVAHLLSCR
jgi:lysophospholipase L1-like esterase